jgi:uncharacterized RmlC-like cupin family protein
VTECRLIRGGAEFQGKQGLEYLSGVSAESAGAEAICMHLLEMPPGAVAKPHYHEAHETAIFALEGTSEMRYGPNLERVMRVEAGDFVYIPPGVPHQPRSHRPHGSQRAGERRPALSRRRRVEGRASPR